jgi:uncharacterized Zn finger protein (UPF0148 family)
MYCPKCGMELPEGAVFCMKCGTKIPSGAATTAKEDRVLAPMEAKKLDCPSCGAPIVPKFGEMVITCEYCGTGIALSQDGWKGVQKQTMLPLKFPDKDQVITKMHDLMDQGLLHRHLQESSKLEEMNLSLVPYWIVSVSATTTIVATSVAVEAEQVATTAALVGLMGAAMGGRRGMGGFAGPMVLGGVMGGAMGAGRGNARKGLEIANNYNFPVVALKALTEHQPRDYQFNLEERTFFEIAKVPSGVLILNGDVGEEAARAQARSLVTQLQSEKAHAQFHMIQQLHTEVEISEAELLHAPIWFARYDYKGKKIALTIDANSGGVINSIGLD